MEQNFVIKVAPEKLKEQAQTVTGYIDAMKKDFDGIRQTVKKTGVYWNGMASDKHREIFGQNEEDIEQILKRLREHPVDLQKMAGVYEQVEETNEQLANSLKEDVF